MFCIQLQRNLFEFINSSNPSRVVPWENILYSIFRYWLSTWGKDKTYRSNKGRHTQKKFCRGLTSKRGGGGETPWTNMQKITITSWDTGKINKKKTLIKKLFYSSLFSQQESKTVSNPPTLLLAEIYNYLCLSLQRIKISYREIFKKPGFHVVCYIGTMPQLVQIETCFFVIIHLLRFY